MDEIGRTPIHLHRDNSDLINIIIIFYWPDVHEFV